MYKTVFVKANFAAEKIVKALEYDQELAAKAWSSPNLGKPYAREIVDRPVISDCQIDGMQTASALNSVLNDHAQNGFELVSFAPVVSGNYGVNAEGSGWGYSYTEGFVVVFKLRL